MAEDGTGRRSLIAWLPGVLLLAVVLVVVTHLSEERALAQLLRRTRPEWLLAAALLQAATYVCAAAVWQRALAFRGLEAGLWKLVPLGVAKLFTDQAVPSAGMSGTLLVVRSLERRGVPRDAAVAALVVGLVAFYLAYALVTVAAVLILRLQGGVSVWVLVPAALLCLLAAVIPLAILVLRAWRVPDLPDWLERLPGARDLVKALREAPRGELLPARLLLETTALQLAVFALDAATLSVMLLAVGHPLPPDSVFASFVVASLVATLAWVPGGLGTFEGTCVAMLHLHDVPVEAALAATLLLRGFTFWLPMLPGLALARREIDPSK